MFLGKRIRELREERELLQRQLAAELEIDTPMFSKIERGDRKAKREQVVKMAKLFEVDQEELISLWLAGQIYGIVKNENEALNALEIVKQLYKD
ncbi:helix-turn-helix domain-containing protein [Marinifilum sp. RC60d5]|uniref:helix-turn-helix domain-containing protein n=1 Tax=Marinifilum sp. RC60d5 TaxID=3458414 RepID=UPI004036F520